MRKSPNKPFRDNGFYNVTRGRQSDHFFVLPTLSISSRRLVQWHTASLSIFAGWGWFFVQVNLFEKTADTSPEFLREHMMSLMGVLSTASLQIADMQACLDFLDKNPHITTIIKNGNLSHPYIQALIHRTMAHQPFIRRPVPERQ